MTAPPPLQVHGTCVVLAKIGVLLCGSSGRGKSDLALRLVDEGASLVADDRVDIVRRAGALWASAPASLAGLLEVRGIGIVRFDGRSGRIAKRARLGLVVDLTDRTRIERLPEPATREFLGVALPRIEIDPWTAAAPAKLRLASELARKGKLFAH